MKLARLGLTELPDAIGGLTELRSLDLSGNRLAVLPEFIGQLTQLELLDLSGNLLAALPESIAQLTKLRQIQLHRNALRALPLSISKLTQIWWLNLGGNRLEALPKSIGELTQLKILNLWGNSLTALPNFIGRLINLEALYLRDNRLTGLPESVGRLGKLRELSVGGNGLATLPKAIVRLVRLKILDLSGNRLATLPHDIERLTQLQNFELDDNRLAALPESIGNLTQLEHLSLCGNRLRSLPEALRNLSKLRLLFLHENPELGLPPELLGPRPMEHYRRKPAASPNEILEYYFRTRGGKRPLNEAKLILVGRGEVGKTSIVNRLIYNRFDPNEKKTEGIKIDPWSVSLAGEEVRLNVWDFGGQEIMHSTHQFFLTQRSLYLLILSGRSDNAEYDADYWLRLILSFGGNSPVIVVLNKIKSHPFDLNRRALEGKYPSIKAIVETDCADETGVDELRQVIERETDRLEGFRDPFPAAWLRIKDELGGMQQNYLTFDEYRKRCTQLGETDATAQENLTTYLHRLGIVLNYRDDPRLRDTHVLNPHWVTNGIYTILNADFLREHHGDLRLEDLSRLLDATDYPSTMHRFLMDLMRKFDLCFTFPGDDLRYLIPELLDKQEPADAADFSSGQNLSFRYDYPILTEGLLPRFIVRTHWLSEDLPRWRTGVILAFEACRALIKADPQERRVSISIAGPPTSRRRLLAVIRAEFEQIHRDITDLNPTEMVPLPKYPGVAVSYGDLLIREGSGKVDFDMVIDGNIVALNARDLLEGVDLAGTRKKEEFMPGDERPLTVFYSYSHKDDSYRNELETHLKILQRTKVIDSWSDRLIEAGDEWKQKIDENLERADIILLLVSADFVASDYCYELETMEALKRHDDKRARVVPIIVRDCNWKAAPFAKLQALPKDGKAVTLWPDNDTAWRDVSEGIQRLAETIRRER